MRIQKRMALAISGAAFAGATALTVGAAVPAGAQASAAPHGIATSHHTVAGHILSPLGGDDDGYGYGYDYGYGYGY